MNYRHRYHAGNFADVLKHVILLELVQGLQRKEKPFLYLDTHAGRGSYDLEAGAQGDSLPRRPEWPDGIGRIEAAPADGRPTPVSRYLAAVREFAIRSHGDAAVGATALQKSGLPSVPDPVPSGPGWTVNPYPGSPCLVHTQLRPRDRMVLCERNPEEVAALADQFHGIRRARVEAMDGYQALTAFLPPLERRALVLLDPPYESTDETARVIVALREGLRRLPGGTHAVWYPLTERVPIEDVMERVRREALAPAWTAELTVVGPDDAMKMKGCGLLIVNPPWRLEREISPTLTWLAATLAQSPQAQGRLRWIVPE